MSEKNNTFYNLEIERSVLGTILVYADSFYEISDVIESKHFYLSLHQEIFTEIIYLMNEFSFIDNLALTYRLEKKNIKLPSGYFATLIATVQNKLAYHQHILELKDLFLKRQVQEISGNINNYLNKPQNKAEVTLAKLEEDIINLLDVTSGQKILSFGENVALLRKQLEDIKNRQFAGVSTSLIDIDRLLGGMQASDLIVLAGRPGMGKTALATNIAYNAAKKLQVDIEDKKEISAGASVLFFSLEMSADQLVTRLLSAELDANLQDLRTGKISAEKLSDIDDLIAGKKINGVNSYEIPFFIDDTPGITIDEMHRKAKIMKRKHNIGLILVDYIQLILVNKYANNRVAQVSEISRKLKIIAKDLKVPVLALSQLSRAVDSRENASSSTGSPHMPVLSDLRESGSIEQDADIVMFIYRESYYLSREEPKEPSSSMETAEGQQLQVEYEKKLRIWEEKYNAVEAVADIIVAKNRHGPTKTIRVGFNPARTSFSNYTSMGVDGNNN